MISCEMEKRMYEWHVRILHWETLAGEEYGWESNMNKDTIGPVLGSWVMQSNEMPYAYR